MVLTEYFSDDTGALLGLAAIAQAKAVHSVKNAPLDRLETVTRVRESPGHDYRHRIVDVGRTHLVVNLDRFDDSGLHLLDFFRIHYLTIHKKL